MTMRTVLALVCLFALLLEPATATGYTIHGVGLGMTREQVEKKLDRPLAAYLVGPGVHGREYATPSGSWVLVQFRDSRALFVEGTTLERASRPFLRQHARPEEVRAALGEPERIGVTGVLPCFGPTKGWRYDAAGVTVNFGDRDVSSFYLSREAGPGFEAGPGPQRVPTPATGTRARPAARR